MTAPPLQQPPELIEPATVPAMCEAVRTATAPLRIRGSGTWLYAGGPWAAATSLATSLARPLSTRALRGVVAYTPGDLVITVHAGTTLADLAQVTGEHAQMLALAPYGRDESTVGALVATAAAAPLPFADLTVRDLVLGVQVVTGTGVLTRAGGHVVKNVAGFDLVRLHTGAFGTLGVITEVSLRLHAQPLCDVLLRVPLRDPLDDVVPRLVVQRAPIPLLLELVPDREPVLWARCYGNGARAASLEERVLGFGVEVGRVERWSLQHEGQATLATIRDATHDHVVLRARAPLSDAVSLVRAARAAFPTGTLRYDPASGSVRVEVPRAQGADLARNIEALRGLAAAEGAHHAISVVIDAGPRAVSPRAPLDAQIKRAFDPHFLLNRLQSEEGT